MSDTYFDTDPTSTSRTSFCGLDDGLCELTPEEFSEFLAHGSLDQDFELN